MSQETIPEHFSDRAERALPPPFSHIVEPGDRQSCSAADPRPPPRGRPRAAQRKRRLVAQRAILWACAAARASTSAIAGEGEAPAALVGRGPALPLAAREGVRGAHGQRRDARFIGGGSRVRHQPATASAPPIRSCRRAGAARARRRRSPTGISRRRRLQTALTVRVCSRGSCSTPALTREAPAARADRGAALGPPRA